jgi:hypothetical protein
MSEPKKVRFVAPRANRGSSWWKGIQVVGLGPLVDQLTRPSARSGLAERIGTEPGKLDLEALIEGLPQEFEIEVDPEAAKAWVQSVGSEAARLQHEQAQARYNWSSNGPTGGHRWHGVPPIVVQERGKCLACGKAGANLVALTTGGYQFPCCGGRDPLGASAKCRHVILDQLKLCVGCGKVDAHGAIGKPCDSCEKALEAGWKVLESEKQKTWVVVDVVGLPGGRHLEDILVRSGVGARKVEPGGFGRQVLAVEESLAPLVQAILTEVDRAQEQALERGQNLLYGLASGEVSVADFNKASVTGRRKE